MSSFLESRLVIINTENGSDGIIFLPTKLTIEVGSDLSCDIRIKHDEVEPKHFEIYMDEDFGKIKVRNFSKLHRIQVNGEDVQSKKVLSSGDIISLMGSQMRWESKAEARRVTQLMSRSERKAKKGRIVKTRKRITIHKVSLSGKFDSCLEEDKIEADKVEAGQKSPDLARDLSPEKEDPEDSVKAFETPVKRNKENEGNLSLLDLSGTLHTSYTPSSSTRSSLRARKTPSRFQPPNSPVKSILSETDGNNIEPKTPGKKSMHLIDLTTPAPFKTNAPSPKSSKKTPATRKENILLKSALKNSTMMKVEATPQQRKALTFAENEEDLNSSCYSSVIDVSSSSEATFKEVPEKFSELEGVKKLLSNEPKDDLRDVAGVRQLLRTPRKVKEPENDLTNVSGVAELMKTPGNPGLSSDDEVKELLLNISTALGEKDSMKEREIEGSIQKIIDQNPESIDSLSGHEESLGRELFEEATKNEMEDVEKKFDELMEVETKPDDDEAVKERGETVMKWIEDVRDSLVGGASQPRQVLDSRFSNITPNTSIASNPASYDAVAPKVSILETIQHFENASKKKQLAQSPVTRMSLTVDNTVVENYQLKDCTKSLRSTRKQFGNAMASLHDRSNLADTTIDESEMLNLNEDDANQSMPQFMSLDGGNKSYIEFATVDENGTVKTVFEISSNDNSPGDDVEGSDSDQMSESEDSDIEEITDGSQEEEMPGNIIKFRLSEQDLEEGVNPLDDSITDDLDDDVEEKEKVDESQENNEEEKNSAESKEKTRNFAELQGIVEKRQENVDKCKVKVEESQEKVEEKVDICEEVVNHLENVDDHQKNVECQEVADSQELAECQELTESQELAERQEVADSQELAECQELTKSQESAECQEVADSQELAKCQELTKSQESAECQEVADSQELAECHEKVNDLQENDKESQKSANICKKVEEPTVIHHKNEEDFNEKLEEPEEFENAEDTIGTSEELNDEIDLPETQLLPDEDSMQEKNEEKSAANGDSEETEIKSEVVSSNELEAQEESMIVEALDDSEVFEDLEATASDFKPENEESLQLNQSEVVYQPQEQCETPEYLEDSKVEPTSQEKTDETMNFGSSEISSKEKDPSDLEDSTRSFDIPATQQPNGDSLVASFDEKFDSVPTTEQLKNDENKVDEFIKPDDTLNHSAAYSFNNSMFSETEFSRVDINGIEIELISDTDETQADEKKKEEMEDELKGLGEVPSTTRRGVSLLPGPGESSEAFNKRKTMAAVAEDEEVDEAFVEKARNLNEMKNMNEKPGGKNRGCSLTPAKEKKLTDPRKTIAPKEVDEKFVEVLKIQSELVKMDEQPAALNTKRAATMMPEDFSKTADQRKSLAPGEAREDFIQFALIQNEMKNIHDEPSVAATKRARSVSPEKKIKPNNRMTIIPQAGEASKDFLKFIDEQNQTKTAEKSSDVEEIDQGESSDESDANEEVVGAMTKTMRESDLPSVEVILDSDEEAEEALENSAQEVPETTAEEASEISVEIHKKIEKIFEVVVEIPEKAEKIDEMSEEVVEIPEKILKETEKVVQILKQTGKISETLEENKEILEKTVNISQETKKIVENPEKNFEKIEKIPEEIPENISEELFEATSIENPEDEAEEIDEGSTEVPKSPEESSKLVPVIEPTCIVKSAYLTTEDAAKVEAIEIPPETPRRRKRAIDYAALDSGSKRTPRRGRSASIDTAPKSLVKRKLTPMKQEPKKLAEQPIEEDVEAVIDITLKIEVSAESDEKPKKTDHIEKEAEKIEEPEKIGKKLPKVEKVEKKKPEKIENQEVLQIEQETEIAEEKSTRRRGQRVNYTALATGTPTRASTSEKLPDKRGRKKLMDEADEKQEPTIAERRVRRGKTPSTADDEVKEVKLQRSKEIHPKTPEVLTKEPEIQSKEPEVLPSTDAQDEAEKPIKIQAKRGRGKKEAIEVELEVPEVVKQPAKRGRRAETPAVETPITVTKTTSRRGKPEPASLTSTEDIELPKAPSKRGRKPTVKVPEAKPVEVAEVLEPAKSLVRKSTKRGRKEIQTTETESQDSTDEAAVVAKPSRRGKKPAEVEPKATEKTTVEVSEPKRDKKEEVESISIAVTKSRRGAAKRKVETSEEEVETVPVIPKDQRIAQLSEEAVATPSKRGRRGTTLEIAEAKPEQKPTRGRKKAVVEETVTVEAVAVEEAPKKGRGRVKKEVSEELTDRKRKAEPTETVEVEQSPEKKPKRGAATVKAVEETVKRTRNMMKKEGATEAESEATPIATGRARRGASETPVKPILARVKKQVTIMTPSTIALAEKTTKATTSRVIKSTITEEPVSKRPTRSRK